MDQRSIHTLRYGCFVLHPLLDLSYFDDGVRSRHTEGDVGMSSFPTITSPYTSKKSEIERPTH